MRWANPIRRPIDVTTSLRHNAKASIAGPSSRAPRAVAAAAAADIGAAAQDAAPKAEVKPRREGARKGRATGTSAAKSADRVPGDITIPRPGSDFMADVLKTLGIQYVAINPASGFRSLHESIINYLGNKNPEIITCMHEEIGRRHRARLRQGRRQADRHHGARHGRPAARVDGHLQRVVRPRADDDLRRQRHATRQAPPGRRVAITRVQDPAAIVRDFVKWDDQPASLQHFAESTVRAYKITMTAPMEPVMISRDIDLQEDAIARARTLRMPKMTRRVQPQGDYAALRGGGEAARRGARSRSSSPTAPCARQQGVKLMVELAEALGAPVVDHGSRMNFPTTHDLVLSPSAPVPGARRRRRSCCSRSTTPGGSSTRSAIPYKTERFVGQQRTRRSITISMQDVYIRSRTTRTSSATCRSTSRSAAIAEASLPDLDRMR